MPMRLAMTQMQQMSAPNAEMHAGLHQLRVVASFDADEQANNLTDWQQHYDQVSPGPFSGS